jgi:hypothetical protein
MSNGPPYLCSTCGQDLTKAVRAERAEDLTALRMTTTHQPEADAWIVRVWCDKDHENVFSGVGNG